MFPEFAEYEEDPQQQQENARRISRVEREARDIARAKAAMARPIPEVSPSVLVDLEKDARTEMNRAFARAFCGAGLRPTTLGEGSAPKELFHKLLQACGATHDWAPPEHQEVSRLLREDLQEVEMRLTEILKAAPADAQVLHTDGWSDPWKGVGGLPCESVDR